MYTALYRAHRPETFDEILGQEHIVKILKNQLAAGAVSHAYLFCGTRGTGKTTTARILAKGVNCTAAGQRPCGTCSNCMSIKDGIFMDVIEIDAASNNGVENIRELRESVKFPPAAGKKKVYIIDEVHMLTTGAFNALLKTLEEPPEHVMFVLATTEAQKLPATILSRCMRLDFKRVPETILTEGMEQICKQKEVEISQGALRLIAANADGSVRDGLSILDQCISTGKNKVERQDVLEFLGAAGAETFIQLTEMVTLGKVPEALLLLSEAIADGKDVRQFMKDWLGHYRNLLITKFIRNPEDMLNLSDENVERVKEQGSSMELTEINRGIIQLSQTIAEAKWSTQPRILLELCIVKMAAKLTNPQAPVRERPQPQRTPQPRQSLEPKTKKQNRKPDPSFETKTHQEAQASPEVQSSTEEQAPPEGGSSKEEQTSPEEQTALETQEVPEFDCDTLWHAIFEEGEMQQGSFNLIRTGTSLEQVGKDSFYITASSQVVAQYIENTRDVLEELMEKHTGKKRTLICNLQDSEANQAKQPDAEALAKTARQNLGIDIEIQ